MEGKKSYTFEEIKQKLVAYCVYQDRCHQEVEAKMKAYLLIPEAKEEILLFLLRENYLNEERFARSYARGKFYVKRWGRVKIRQHLKQKGINEKLILKSFEEIEEEDYRIAMQDLARRHYDWQGGGKDFLKKQKTIRYMLGRGFEYEGVLEALETIASSED